MSVILDILFVAQYEVTQVFESFYPTGNSIWKAYTMLARASVVKASVGEEWATTSGTS